MVDNVHVQTTQAREDAVKKQSKGSNKNVPSLKLPKKNKKKLKHTSCVMALIETSPMFNAVDYNAAFPSKTNF